MVVASRRTSRRDPDVSWNLRGAAGCSAELSPLDMLASGPHSDQGRVHGRCGRA